VASVLTVLTISLAKHQFAYPHGQRPVGIENSEMAKRHEKNLAGVKKRL